MGAGIIISQTTPDMTNRYTWLKPLEGGGYEAYEPADGGWQKVLDIAAPATVDHTHETLGSINITGTVKVNNDAGVTGSKTIGGYTLTFKQGILTGFQQA